MGEPATPHACEETGDSNSAPCPWCGEVQTDLYEYFRDTNNEIANATCDSCGKDFELRAEYSVTYYSSHTAKNAAELKAKADANAGEVKGV